MKISSVFRHIAAGLRKPASRPSRSELVRAAAEVYSKGDAADAERRYRAALALAPDDRDAWNGLGLALQSQERLEEAEAAYLRAVADVHAPEAAHFNLGVLLHMRGRHEAALALLDAFSRRFPSDADAHVAIGAALERLDRAEEALAHFARAAELAPRYALASTLRFSRVALRELDRSPLREDAPETAVRKVRGEPRLVTLVACDSFYLRRYGAAFVRSFAHAGAADTLLHVHLLDPQASDVTDVEALIAASNLRAYRITLERDARFEPRTRSKATFYTCARWLHLPGWLREYQLPVAVLDVDLAFQRPAQCLLQSAGEDVDAGLYIKAPRAPWLDFLAGIAVLRPTAPALRFSGLVARYIEHCLATGATHWHLDQIALFCSYRMLQRFETAPRIASIREAADAALFHVGKYDERMNDPRWARYG